MRKYLHLSLGIMIALTTIPYLDSTARAHSLPKVGVYGILVPQSRNEISGTVFGESHRAVADVYVELLDEVGSTVGHSRTTYSGRFTFVGLSNGTFKIKVLPFGTDYREQIQEVVLAAISARPGGGVDRQNIDIYLKLNDRANSSPFAAAPGVVFAQEIPPAAKKYYDEGVIYLHDKKEKEGMASLKKAIESFPTYYLALDRLGAEYAMRGNSNRSYWEAGLVLLSKAVEVNPRGYSSVFGLGWTQYQLGLNTEAIETLRHATVIYGKSADPFLWLGKALRHAHTYAEAEVAFKRANELSGGKVADIHWEMAGLYSDQKRYNESADELELYLKTAPKGTDSDKIKRLIKQLREQVGKA
jgi:Tfp pilus assembly protein PilF